MSEDTYLPASESAEFADTEPGPIETKTYEDGTTVTGLAPLPEMSPTRLEPTVGAKVLFFTHSVAGVEPPNAEMASITRVWGTGKGGCVNLDNGMTSVPCFVIGDTGLPAGYYCLLFVDQPDLRDPNVPEEPPVYFPGDTSLPIFNHLAHARALPEVSDDSAIDVFLPPECISHFKGADGRTMRIVFTECGFAKQEVPARA